jgi:hypothetical protein
LPPLHFQFHLGNSQTGSLSIGNRGRYRHLKRIGLSLEQQLNAPRVPADSGVSASGIAK